MSSPKRTVHPHGARKAAPPTAKPAAAPLPAAALLIPLAALLALRIACSVAPGSWGWGLAGTRFVGPALGWALIAVMALALLPPVGGALAAALAPLDRRVAAAPRGATLAAAALAAALVLLLSDRATFIGDFQMRQQAIESDQFERFLPESLPLDVLVHDRLPRTLQGAWGLAPEAYARALGALEAALLAALALALVRPGAHGGAARAPAASPSLWLALPVVLGAPLAVFTGFPKSTSDLCVLTLAAAVLGVRLARGARVHLAFGLVLALAVLDHRAMLVLLPAAAYLAWTRLRANDSAGALAMATVPPLVTLAAMAPRLDRILTEYDLPMHLAQEGAPPGGAAAGLAGGALRALDAANALLLVAPAVVAALALRGASRAAPERTERRFLLVLALSFAPVVMLVQPRQGLFRDWEILAPAGIAAAALIARVLAARIEAHQASPRLAPALALAVAAPALALLVENHSAAGALPRANTLIAGPPARTEVERTFLWDYVSGRDMALGRWREAAAAIEEVARVKPDRGVLLSWGFAAVSAGDFVSARRAFAQLVEASPGDAAGIAGLGGVAARLGDATTASEMRARLAPVLADARTRRALAQMLRDHPTLWPELARSLAAR